ncbi:MAG: lactonase family protein [Planctomycetaceae bacterium]|nr:lactonase family protein [Planctomycetaceae bacterium]
MMRLLLLLTALLVPFLFNQTTTAEETDETMDVYFGTYTQGDSRGIYKSTFNSETGALTAPELVAKTPEPSFLALHPTRPLLYAVNETSDYQGKSSGSVTAFSINEENGSLSELNQQASHGASPCHIDVDPTGRNVLIANYHGGSVAVLPIKEDGSLADASCVIQHEGSSVNESRQEGPHAHSINLDATGEFAFVADLGLDKILVYRFDPVAGTLIPHEPPSTSVPPGSGPRHFAMHPSAKFAYTNHEITSEVRSFRYHPPTAVLYGFQTISSIPEEVPGNSTAEIQVHPSGKFVYCSNRGHDSIAVYSVNEETGELSFIEAESTHGQTPRNFGIDPSGKFVIAANQSTDNAVVLRIDQETGALSTSGHSIKVPSAVCVKFRSR